MRNITDAQKTYLLGKLYEARRNTHGGDRRSEEFSTGSNSRMKPIRARDGVSGLIAAEQGINEKTVRVAEHFAKGLDEAEKVKHNILWKEI